MTVFHMGFLLMPDGTMQGICSSGFARAPGSSMSPETSPGLLKPDALGRGTKVEIPVAVDQME
jgi:hypothetical protein